jgi:hypothetical protein
MIVLRHLVGEQRNVLASGNLTHDVRAESNARALMDGHTALKVREREIRNTIPSVRGSEERKQSAVLTNRHQLPIAKRPSVGSKIPANHPYFSEKWFCHIVPSSFSVEVKVCSSTCRRPGMTNDWGDRKGKLRTCLPLRISSSRPEIPRPAADYWQTN